MNFRFSERKKHMLMMVLLLILTITVRLQNDHQTDFDSYWLHAQAESIQIHNSALWVFHPTSLFGYYPLSYPSGTMFFLATTSTLTGLDMNQTILITSILIGVLITFLVLILTEKITEKWTMSYLAAFIVSLSPLLINYTAFNAGGRVLVLTFTLALLVALFQWKETGKKRYLLLCAILLAFSVLTHRTSQFIAVYIIAFAAALITENIPLIQKRMMNNKHYKKYLHKRYKNNRYRLLADLLIIILVLLGAKITDLIMRGRLSTNTERLILLPGKNLLTHIQEHPLLSALIIGGILLSFIIAAVLMSLVKKQSILTQTKKFLHHHYHELFNRPDKYFVVMLGAIALYLFTKQFLGGSFYSPSLDEFYTSELISGTSPPIIFINFLVNYTTSVTALFIFYFIGFIMLLRKKQKSFAEWFLIYAFIGFSGVLLDKRYVRLFIIPFIAIITSYGLLAIIAAMSRKAQEKKSRLIMTYLFSYLVGLLIVLGMFAPLVRQTVFGEETGFEHVEPYWEAGQYLKSLDCECSTLTTDELVAGVVLFASSGIPGGSHNIYYYVDEEKLTPIPMTYEEVKASIQRGDKIQNLYYLPDWILGGTYYVGRHTIYLFQRPFTDPINTIIMNDYQERFYNHDKLLEKNTFLESIEPVKNIIYDNDRMVIYDLEKGRDVT